MIGLPRCQSGGRIGGLLGPFCLLSSLLEGKELQLQQMLIG